MMIRISLRLAVLALLVVTSTPLLGQVTTGLPPFGSFGGGPFDTVNNANLNVHFQIPVISKAGRGLPFYYILSYDTSIWSTMQLNGSTVWTPVGGLGWTEEGATGHLSYSQTLRPMRYKPIFVHVLELEL